jgi:urease beta subunit
MEIGRTILGKREVLPGVAPMIGEVHVEGTFPDGTKLVAVRAPVTAEAGNLELALYGSFLPLPDPALFGAGSEGKAGAVVPANGTLTLNEGRATVTLRVTNTDARPIQVEANPRLSFDRNAAYGMRLDIPAGTAVRFEPGETKEVTLVEIAGNKIIRGGNRLADGQVSSANRKAALSRVKERAFGNRA